jgi:hypothetical protein
MDPCDAANLSGVRDYLHSLGFSQVYYGQLYHVWYFNNEIKRIHEEDPEARFVLIGFSFGANMVRDLAQWARERDTMIDLLVYLGGNTLKNCPEDMPENVLQIVNILAHGCIWNGDTMDGAINMQVSGFCWHFGSPTHKETIEVLTRELATVAARVPIMEPALELPPGLEEAPTPRPVKPAEISAKRAEWDFLKPANQLSTPPPTVPVQASGPGQGVVQSGQETARPLWTRGTLAPAELNHEVAAPGQ